METTLISVPLTKGHVAIISGEDADLLRYSLTLSEDGDGRPYVRGYRDGKQPPLHRMVMERAGFDIRGKPVDHIDGDPLNNTRENLRVVSAAENSRNRSGARRDSGSGVLGVYQRADKWRAMLRRNGQLQHLGTYPTKEEATAARLAAEREQWGVQPRRAEAHAA